MADFALKKSSYLNYCDFIESQGFFFFDTPYFILPEVSDGDVFLTIDSSYVGRLDLISYDYYGDPELWWVIALANGLDDIPNDVSLNLKIRIPDPSKVSDYLESYKNVPSV